ncbi:PAS domain-containing hybrid sensor histidine kinase/response regulator [Hyalangium versicolor]|uniref:PAS domain-containing hybrid sensor histidine kinase/response regulator n=1 Tax=Hyalangium versicolor TaxID=2861190 RepID=UPI001CC97BF6|nr:PAS domain-containing hybrid sensor histidine kinase/response regulator [Hyalangium versicolor]
MDTSTRIDAPEAPPEESAEELYEHAPCGHLSTLPNGTIVRVNQTFLDWTGYSREELLAGMRFQDLLNIGGKMFHETHYAPLLRMQGFVREINFELVGKQGGALPALINTVQKKDAAGKPVLHRTTVFGFAERKSYERELLLARKKAEQAEQLARSRTELLSTISHEIRTPMNAILGLSGLLQHTPLSSEQARYVALLQASSENLLGLLNHILDFSKIEAGKVTLEERRFHLRQLVNGILYGLRVKAEEKDLAIHVELDERVPAWLMGDPVKISQVLTNLLANAIKFTEQGSVTLSVQLQDTFAERVSVSFRVTDTGIGIPEERQSQIFEEFTQASYDIHLKYGGSGLGLAICQRLLALYGCKLGMESRLGQGSSFSFALSLKVAPDTPESALPAAAKSPIATCNIDGVQVLVADDNTVNVFVITQYLRKWGARFDVVENGRLAVEQAQQIHYDMVLMDLQMPELDGYDATRLIRKLPAERFRKLPIVALTASDRIGLEERIAAAGFTDFVCKPFTPEELHSKIAFCCGRTQAAFTSPVEADKTPRSPEAPGAEASTPRFSLEGLHRLAEGDPEALAEFITITIASAEKHKHAFQEALEQGNLDEFAFQAHQIKMTVELLQAHVLRTALQQGKALLTGKESDPARIRSAVQAIHTELDSIIHALQSATADSTSPGGDPCVTPPQQAEPAAAG